MTWLTGWLPTKKGVSIQISSLLSHFPGQSVKQYQETDVHIDENGKQSQYLNVKAELTTTYNGPVVIDRSRKGAGKASETDLKQAKHYADLLMEMVNDPTQECILPLVASDNKDLLFYNGYALVSDDLRKLKIAQKILQSNVFWYYIKNSSKPYGGDYYALAKNYVKDFGYISLTKEEEEVLLKFETTDAINKFIEDKYSIRL